VILVDDPGVGARAMAGGSAGLYARVSSYDQRADLDRQVARLSQWAA
jgi:putative resolvase